MASVKISVDNLNQQKREYDKAIKNLDNALEQIKKVNHSLGKDAMLEEVRNGLARLSASLETRAGVLLLMTKALEQSGEKYIAAQKKAVTKSNQFRAHNRDFYGNPVVVTAATATAMATTATAETTASAPGIRGRQQYSHRILAYRNWTVSDRFRNPSGCIYRKRHKYHHLTD